MHLAGTYNRNDAPDSSRRGRIVAGLFRAHPSVNTIRIYERGGSGRQLPALAAGTAYYIMSSSGRWGRKAELRLTAETVRLEGAFAICQGWIGAGCDRGPVWRQEVAAREAGIYARSAAHLAFELWPELREKGGE